MENKKIGTLLLTGLITGSMLGSGIILLPPLAYRMLGNYAILAWLFTFFLGGLFAYVFMKLSIAFPGSEGVALAVEEAFGERAKLLTSYFLIFAVCAGPTAVMMIAGEYLSGLLNYNINTEIYALILAIICFFILLCNITSVSKITLFLSTFISITLTLSSLVTLTGFKKIIVLDPVPEVALFGKTALLLFWAVVGWEVIGNYSLDVKNPKTTIKKSVIISFSIVTIIYFLTAFAIQSIDLGRLGIDVGSQINLSAILVPVFGNNSKYIMTFITVSLCISTYVLFVGGCARLIQSLASNGHFPKFFSKKSSSNVPITAVLSLSIIHSIECILANYGLLSIDAIVAYANVFFICNALLGIFSFMKLYRTKSNLISSSILSLILITLLFFSSKIILLIPMTLTAYSISQSRKNKKNCGTVL